jgi:hypothetical protein
MGEEKKAEKNSPKEKCFLRPFFLARHLLKILKTFNKIKRLPRRLPRPE